VIFSRLSESFNPLSSGFWLFVCRALVAQSGSLATIRDALLSKLLFGKIRVNDAEQYSTETLEQ
jgi:hypothetical protein